MTATPGRPSTADVTVITVTYEAAPLVLECLDSLAQQDLDGLTMDVVVVDNASTDGTAELVAREHPGVTVLRSPRNTGFAGGNNLALRSVTSPLVVLLNNDAVAAPGAIAALVRALRSADPAVAALSATVLLRQRFRPAGQEDEDVVIGPDGAWSPDPEGDVTLVNSTGNVVLSSGYGTDRGWLAEASQHRPPREVFGFCGAAAAIRMSALDEVGLFDDDFFLYYEDSDLSWRLRLAGHRIEHCPDAVVHHHHAASTREGSDLFLFHDGRNRLLMLIKDATAGLAVRALLRFMLTTASVTVRRSAPRHQVLVRWRVLGSAARLLPLMLRKRRAIGRAARVSRAAVETMLEPAPRSAGRAYRRTPPAGR